jgi:hypothetical protein
MISIFFQNAIQNPMISIFVQNTIQVLVRIPNSGYRMHVLSAFLSRASWNVGHFLERLVPHDDSAPCVSPNISNHWHLKNLRDCLNDWYLLGEFGIIGI